MHALLTLLILWTGLIDIGGAASVSGTPSALMLADESVRFDANLRPLFTRNQIMNSRVATRSGLQRWAATEHGRRILERLNANEYTIVITEDESQPSAGRAPQPGIATLASSGQRSKVKVYELILNPGAFRPVEGTIAVVPPLTAADMMALAWAAEMLHIDFYARGISLPHHRRDDFQREWLGVATELGMPRVRHDDGDDEPRPRRSPESLPPNRGRW